MLYEVITPPEKRAMMTLWCVFRSPLMLGAELTLLDGETLSLITNPAVLRLATHGRNPRQLERGREKGSERAVWASDDAEDGSRYLALFNLSDGERAVPVPPGAFIGLGGEIRLTELWTGASFGASAGTFPAIPIPPHGALLYKLESL